jgi:hypothetical protein
MQALKAHRAGRRQTARDEGWRKWHLEKATGSRGHHRIIRSSISTRLFTGKEAESDDEACSGM